MPKLLSGFNPHLRRVALGIDRKPVNPDAMDDEFDDGSFNTSKWTWLDQGSTTASEVNDRLILTLPSDSNRMRGIYQSTPTAPWVFRAKLYWPAADVDGNNFHFLFAGESTTGEIRGIGVYSAAVVRALTYATPSSSLSSWESGQAFGRHSPEAVYVQLAYDGNELVASFGMNGGFGYRTHVSPAYTPGLIGLGVTNDQTATAQYPFGWFRRVV